MVMVNNSHPSHSKISFIRLTDLDFSFVRKNKYVFRDDAAISYVNVMHFSPFPTFPSLSDVGWHVRDDAAFVVIKSPKIPF